MNKIMMFECEICKEVYRSEEEAKECEFRGKEQPLVEVGQFIDYEVKVGGGFDSFYVEQRISNVEDNGHYYIYYLEEYDEDSKTWYESNYKSTGIYGNQDFLKCCTIQK